MPKRGLTQIICVLDRSGSMESIRDDAIGGFNSFLEAQKKEPGEATMTLVMFDNEYTLLHSVVPLGDVPPLSRATFVPRGSTALLDAIGRVVEDIQALNDSTPEDDKPERSILVILTDGAENASRRFTRDAVNELIKRQKEVYRWEVVFLAANQDAIQAGKSIGVDADRSYAFAATASGTRDAYDGMTKGISSFRKGVGYGTK